MYEMRILNEKKYWFTIDPYVHISVKKNTVVFYNAYNGKILEYKGNKKISALANRFRDPKNLQVVQMKESELQNPDIREFVRKIRSLFMGDLIDSACSEGKPIQMMPIVKIQKDVKYLDKNHGRSIGEDVMNYLSSVSFYINDDCLQSCDVCRYAYRQNDCCTSTIKGNRQLKIEHIANFLEEIKECLTAGIKVLGGNIFAYKEWPNLLDLLWDIPNKKTFYLHYLNAFTHRHLLQKLVDANTSLIIPVSFPIDQNKLETVNSSATALGLIPVYHFLIQGENDFETADAFVSESDLPEFEFQAVYNGENLDFFSDNLFIETNDIVEERPSLQTLYAREKVNALNFGKLSILPDHRIYANVNHAPLGFLGKDSVYDIICKELKNGKSWRYLRKNVMPCKSCNYSSLCPPVSNYNIAIGKMDLCHIRRKENE